MTGTHPALMTAEARLEEVAHIFAIGLLRHRQKALDSIASTEAICDETP